MEKKRSVSRRTFLCVVLTLVIAVAVVGGVYQVQNTHLQNQVSSKSSTINSLESTIVSLEANITNLKNQVASVTASNSSLTSQLNSETKKYSSETSLTQATQTADQTTITTEEAQVNSNQYTISQDNSQINSLDNQVSTLQNELNVLDSDVVGEGFSIVQITDTQYLSDSYPQAYADLTSWIVNNSKALNLAMVVHTGDIVQLPSNTTDWQAANAAMMTLYDNEVPYTWCAGNHDQIGSDGVSDGNVNGTWIGGNYPAFNVTNMRNLPYWVGDIYDGTSTAVKFSFDNYQFMIIDVEYDANQTVLNWMQSLIQANPNVNVIVATHNFLNGNGTLGTLDAYDVTWATNFNKILNQYPNVFLTLNGHDYDYAPAYNIRVGNREEIFFNRQQLDNLEGAATARIYVFNMANASDPTVSAYTYQTYGTPHYLTDPANQFTFTASLIPSNPAPAQIASNTSFQGASGYSVSFASAPTLQGFTQYGDTLTFNGLTMNGVTSNFTVTSVGSNIVINSINPVPGGSITFAVDTGGGTEMFSTPTAPTAVYFGNTPAPASDWNYSSTALTTVNQYSTSMGEVTVTGATSSVTIDF